MENSKINFEDFINRDFRRAEQMKVKSQATYVTFFELANLLNVTGFVEEYLMRTRKWFDLKMSPQSLRDKNLAFTTEDYAQITDGLRSLAKRLNDYADAIDAAEE